MEKYYRFQFLQSVNVRPTQRGEERKVSAKQGWRKVELELLPKATKSMAMGSSSSSELQASAFSLLVLLPSFTSPTT